MKDRIFRATLFLAAGLIVLLTAGIVYGLVSQSMDALTHFGPLHFITSPAWDSRSDDYGALSFIAGTLLTAVLALAFCIPFSFSASLFNGEYFRGRKIATVVGSIVDLLAGVPSIVFGLWGFYTLRPLLAGAGGQGFGILLASIVLAIMIIPYASSLSAEFIAMTPSELKEGAYSLGATRMEVVRYVSLPVAGSGILASYMLAFGRALGETMAVTMLIGNTNNLPHGLTDTGNTMASIIANQFGEAGGLKLSSLMAIGLLLFLLTATINFLSKYILKCVTLSKS
ncbi:MAG: phosphate ABC transporter permease subunit PstC [Tannerellaceae bacterium]|jgi:phosphate transport system permease protein|nr:phosphate ABC transporter permease subunit PstC [Tannerellaceae bacterium]